jgi:2-polyprenyl-3-methyl-5-hydroxy-6-metoxy-1,4-benzoquinol methylase
MWSAGDFARVAARTVLVGELLCRSLDIHAGERVLDVAAGSGNAAIAAARRDASVTATDIVEPLLAAATERAAIDGLSIATAVADAQELPFEDESFDVVVAGELLEHLRDPRRVVGEIRRVLRPGGRFVGSVPNFFRLRNRLLMLVGRRFDHDPTHLQIFAPQDVRALLGDFDGVELRFISSRFLRLSPRLFANIIVFTGTKKR